MHCQYTKNPAQWRDGCSHYWSRLQGCNFENSKSSYM
ncbi:MAG TPA: hypothetical protein DIS97_16615 [Citrobacter freundii]|nr:hypothetical protein [Citrobacter freundii]